MQAELDKVLDEYEMTMKHMGLSYYRLGDQISVLSSNTSVVIVKSFRNCENGSNSCTSNYVYGQLKDGNAVLSPYTMWTFHYKTADAQFNKLQRFADHVDIELVGAGTYVKGGFQTDQVNENHYY